MESRQRGNGKAKSTRPLRHVPCRRKKAGGAPSLVQWLMNSIVGYWNVRKWRWPGCQLSQASPGTLTALVRGDDLDPHDFVGWLRLHLDCPPAFARNRSDMLYLWRRRKDDRPPASFTVLHRFGTRKSTGSLHGYGRFADRLCPVAKASFKSRLTARLPEQEAAPTGYIRGKG